MIIIGNLYFVAITGSTVGPGFELTMDPSSVSGNTMNYSEAFPPLPTGNGGSGVAGMSSSNSPSSGQWTKVSVRSLVTTQV